MMDKEPGYWIRQFYDSIKDDYPHLSFNQVDNVCRAGSRFLKHVMASGSLLNVRWRYFASFVVFKKRVEGLKQKTIKMYGDGKIGESDLNRVIKMCDEYIKREI